MSDPRRGLITATIGRGSDTASLSYAPDGHRYEAEIAGSAGTTTVWYLAGGAFRVEQEPDGTLIYRQAIVAGGAMVGQLTTESTAASGLHYLYRDALGSTAALAGVAGTGAQALAYGPYGRRREAANWSSVLSASQLTALNLPTRRGYTGGESLDALGVVVLGARLYVPALARFLSPDPAGVGNPYGYVADDPLNDTDPTGALNWNSVGKIAEAAVIAVASFYTAGAVSGATGSLVAGDAAGGFVAGYAGSGGNLEDGAIGALGGAAMGYFGGITGGANPTKAQLFSRGVAEGLVGGTLSTVATHGANGSFASGFLGAFAAAELGGNLEPNSSSGEAMALRTTAMAVVGGTAAEIGGGSFANGAISAAFQQIFNELAHAELRAQWREWMMAKYGAMIKYGNISLSSEAAIAPFLTDEKFYEFVHNGGPWDYKDSQIFENFKNKALLTNFGNFNYGFVAHAHGWSLGLAVMGAGLYQMERGYSSLWYTAVGYTNLAYSAATVNISSFLSNNGYAESEINYSGVRFGDNPGDSMEIEAGYEYYGIMYGP